MGAGPTHDNHNYAYNLDDRVRPGGLDGHRPRVDDQRQGEGSLSP